MNNQKKILVLCTGNSCRSIMAEGLINHFGKDYFQAFSAGSNPAGFVHPMSIKTLKKSGILKSDYKSQSWDEFSDMYFDLVITVCDNAAGESCPVYLSNTPKVHWGVEDPAKFCIFFFTRQRKLLLTIKPTQSLVPHLQGWSSR